jgi:hypothetical protein
MVLTLPASVPSMGTRRVVFIPGTVADINAITLAEVTSAENISCYLVRSGGWAPTTNEGTITDSRYCSAQDFEQPGTVQRQLSVQYTFNLADPTADEARLALQRGTVGVLVHLLQVDEDAETFAADDWYEAVPVKAGVQTIQPVEDNAVDRISQKMFVTGEWSEFSQLVAA